MDEFTRIVPTSVTEDVIKDYLTDGKTMLDIKSLSLNDKVAIIKIALNCDDVTDPLMIMNLINLVKVYNTLADDYFESPDVYVNSVEELLDLKLALSANLKEFARNIVIYFLSILKSYHKTSYNSTDSHKPLPSLYNMFFWSVDFLTLSGILAKAPEVSTKDLTFIDGAPNILMALITKSANSLVLMEQFFKDKEVGE